MTSSAAAPSRFETVAIVGVGLIGGSLGGALRRKKLARVIGVGRNAGRLEAARQAGVIDEAARDIRDAAARADLIVFCTPVDRIAADAREAASVSRKGTLLTDAGSVKGPICDALASGLPDGITFIGSHPLAGSEKQGFEHSNPQLYEGRVCVITPLPHSPRGEVARLRHFWEAVGSRVIELSPVDHDRALAQTSHVPHVVAAALAATLDRDCAPLAASGFRDTTRIAGGDPDLWVAILLENAEAVLASLKKYENVLGAFTSAVGSRDAESLRQLLAEARDRRESLRPSGFPAGHIVQ
jgi:prephenate dehydrogenase